MVRKTSSVRNRKIQKVNFLWRMHAKQTEKKDSQLVQAYRRPNLMMFSPLYPKEIFEGRTKMELISCYNDVVVLKIHSGTYHPSPENVAHAIQDRERKGPMISLMTEAMLEREIENPAAEHYRFFQRQQPIS